MFQCSNVVGKAGPQYPSVMIIYIYNNNITYPMFWNVCQNDILTYNHIQNQLFSHGNSSPDAQCTAELCGDGSPNLDGLEARDNQQQLPPGFPYIFRRESQTKPLFATIFIQCYWGRCKISFEEAFVFLFQYVSGIFGSRKFVGTVY